MKFKPKHALAALAIAVAGPASAQVLTNLSSSGNSSFYFTAVDEVAGRSYFSEMVATAGSTTTGVLRFEDLVTNPSGTWSVTLSGLNTFAAGSASLDNLFGGFGAADTNATVGGGTSQPTGNRRLVTSVAQGAAEPQFSNSQVGAAASAGVNMDNFVGQVVGECSSSPCIATSPTQLAYNVIGNASAIGLQWGFSAGPSIANDFSGEIAWDIYLAVTAGANAQPASVTQLALTAVLNLANGVLTISGPPSDVPVPAAVWLLGSAMLGFVGIGRRKKGQAALPAEGAVAA